MRAKFLNHHIVTAFGPLAFGISLLLTSGAMVASLTAQEISDTHVSAARSAISAIKATDQFDSFLSEMSFELKNELMRKDPNLEEAISATVEEEAIKLAPRRADLEKEVALAYARHFTEEELTRIADFYNSAAGQKLLREGPAAMNETLAAFDIWRQGMAQDLSVNVARALSQKLGSPAEQEAVEQEAPQSEGN